MTGGDYYFDDPRVVLVPIEHLTAQGVSAELASLLRARAGWPSERIALLDDAFSRYWSRGTALARRTWFSPAAGT